MIATLEKAMQEMDLNGVITLKMGFREVGLICAALKAQEAYTDGLDAYMNLAFNKSEGKQ
jgi:hypothetical protein